MTAVIAEHITTTILRKLDHKYEKAKLLCGNYKQKLLKRVLAAVMMWIEGMPLVSYRLIREVYYNNECEGKIRK